MTWSVDEGLGAGDRSQPRDEQGRFREPTVNAEELRHLLDSAQTGDGEWRPEPDLDGEGLRRRRDTIWLTDDDGCSLQVDEDDAALMVAALRSSQLQVIERDRLAEALRGQDGVLEGWDWDDQSPPGWRHLRLADAIIRALDSTTGDETG